MEEQIKRLQEELEIVKKERDNLRLEKKKTFIKTRLKNKSHTQGLYPTYEKETVQELIREYGQGLVVECMIELFSKEEENEGNQI